MSLVEINWSPTSRQLRQFGALCIFALPLIGWLWGGSPSCLAVLLGVGSMIAAMAWRKPQLIRPLFVGLMVIAAPIGMVMGELSMLSIYFCIFLPIGLVFRMLRRDPLQRKIDRTTDSYWQLKTEPKDVASYYRRF